MLIFLDVMYVWKLKLTRRHTESKTQSILGLCNRWILVVIFMLWLLCPGEYSVGTCLIGDWVDPRTRAWWWRESITVKLLHICVFCEYVCTLLLICYFMNYYFNLLSYCELLFPFNWYILRKNCKPLISFIVWQSVP